MYASSPTAEYVILSVREMEILNLILEGKSSKEVAYHLFLSRRTIDSHLSKIYRKLDVTNRIQAILKATELGIISSRVC